MSNPNFRGPTDPVALGKQLWDTWTGFAQQQLGAATAATGSAAPAGMPNWQDGMKFWSQLAGRPGGDASHAVEQMTRHGQQLMEMLQTLATQAGSGQAFDAGTLVERWKGMFGGADPMFDTLRNIAGDGARGWDQFADGLEPVLAALRGERNQLLGMPAFGLSRERQERLQAIARAHAEYAERNADYMALLAKASQRGLARFESKLAERSEPGRQVDSLRGLYDLWIDAAEEAYAEVAMSDEFRSAYGAMVNAQMRLKQQVQHEVDQQVGALGLPTRAELDGAHRKIHAMQRELRELKALLRQRPVAAAAPRAAPADGADRPAARKAATRPKPAAAKRTPAKSAPAKAAPAKAAPAKAAPAKAAPAETARSSTAARKRASTRNGKEG